MILTQLFLPVLILTHQSLLIYAGEEADVEALCNATDTARVEYEYNTEIVNSEHIITYKGYFPRKTRENYVSAALRNAGVSYCSSPIEGQGCHYLFLVNSPESLKKK